MTNQTDLGGRGLIEGIVIVRRAAARQTLPFLRDECRAARRELIAASDVAFKALMRYGDEGPRYLRRRRHYEHILTIHECVERRYAEARDESECIEDEQRRLVAAVGLYLSGVRVDPNYCQKILLVQDEYGSLNIYFGGIRKPDGWRHGHYVVRPNGYVAYARNPGRPHGPQNFCEPMALFITAGVHSE